MEKGLCHDLVPWWWWWGGALSLSLSLCLCRAHVHSGQKKKKKEKLPGSSSAKHLEFSVFIIHVLQKLFGDPACILSLSEARGRVGVGSRGEPAPEGPQAHT